MTPPPISTPKGKTLPQSLGRVEIFSPRPKTPATPPSFPFLSTPSPDLKRSKTTVSPPTPPRRPRTRQTVSADNVFMVQRRTNFETTLAAFPAPPARAASLSLFTSRSTPPSDEARGADSFLTGTKSPGKDCKGQDGREERQDGESEEMMLEWTDDDSDGRTVTGIPATPSTASSGWDTFWSEPASPADAPTDSGKLTEAARIREAYLNNKLSSFADTDKDMEPEFSHIEHA